jgi:hypothetical protein
MKNQERIRDRYLRDPLPVRLAGLAADLFRVSSSARRATGGDAVAAMLEESQYFIEWTATEAPLEVAEELVNLQVLLALWRRAWPDIQHNQSQRGLLVVQAKQWADQVLGFSGDREVSQRLEAIDREQRAYEAQHVSLLESYAGEYVAFYQGQLVDHDVDRAALGRRVRSRYENTPVLITPVHQEARQTIVVRSPRLLGSVT